MTKKYTSPEEALHLMYKFCAYRERSHKEVRSKLLSLNIYGDDLEEIMSQLISEGFLNEVRFAQAYVSGKFRIKQWGRRKIWSGLKMQNISEYAMRKAWLEIDEEEYLQTLQRLLEKKWRVTTAENEFLKKQKVGKFLIQKGYESELVWRALKSYQGEE